MGPSSSSFSFVHPNERLHPFLLFFGFLVNPVFLAQLKSLDKKAPYVMILPDLIVHHEEPPGTRIPKLKKQVNASFQPSIPLPVWRLNPDGVSENEF
jgi:hypothetical protein